MSVLLSPPPYGSLEWVEWRKHAGVGASEAPALLGVDPWRGEYAVWLAKRGLDDPVEDTAAIRWGHRIEAVALDAVDELMGTPCVRGETWRNDRWPHAFATLDGRLGTLGIEVKASTRWRELPERVRVQALAQIGIAELDAVDVVRVSPYGEPQITRVERDEAVIADLLDFVEAWYVRHVVGGEEPPVDATPATGRYLDGRRGDEEREATAEQSALMGTLRGIRQRRDALDKDERAVIHALKRSMAGTGTLRGDGFRIAWQAVKGRTTVDWQRVAAELAAPEEVAAMAERFTTAGEGTTRFVPTWDEEG